jgi:DNA invertase Pin-like site-specific DNA recombinase
LSFEGLKTLVFGNNVCAVIAELEKGIIRERTKAGLQSARARGRVGGAPPKTDAQQRSAIVTMWESRKHSGRDREHLQHQQAIAVPHSCQT